MNVEIQYTGKEAFIGTLRPHIKFVIVGGDFPIEYHIRLRYRKVGVDYADQCCDHAWCTLQTLAGTVTGSAVSINTCNDQQNQYARFSETTERITGRLWKVKV